MNVEHRTSNIECLMGRDREVCFSLDVQCSMFILGRSGVYPRPTSKYPIKKARGIKKNA
jgi:hypothetical protein